MATWDDIRAAALTLPGAWENSWYGEPCFHVGKKGFVQGFRGRCIMKLEKNHQ